jgi:hypothetical protein
MVATFSGSFMTVAWSTVTASVSAAEAWFGGANAKPNRHKASAILIVSLPQPRLIFAIIATLRGLELTIDQHGGAVRRCGFDCKMVNEVQM